MSRVFGQSVGSLFQRCMMSCGTCNTCSPTRLGSSLDTNPGTGSDWPAVLMLITT